MDDMLLIGLAAAVAVILVLLVAVTARREAPRPDDVPGDGLATSTEGMKICPSCGMGNLWTERSCSACGAPLKG